MTGGAGAGVLRKRVGDSLIVLLVTASTADVGIVVAGIVTAVRMAKRIGRPTLGAMTGITIFRCYEMPRPFSGGAAAVVAGNAIARYACVIPGGTLERRRSMTDGTIQVGEHVIRILAGGVGAVMARRTAIDDARVIKCCRKKGTRIVTDSAVVASGNMVNGFAGCQHAVVTQHAIIDDTRVVKCGGGKAGGKVA